MSALWAPVTDRPLSAPAPEGEQRPRLRALPGGLPRLARVPFVLVLIAIFGVGMTGLLMLNTTLQNRAFEASALNRQATELAYTQADLESRLDRLSAPQVLAWRATTYGLRANPFPAFLQLPKGKVVGKPEAVKGDEVPSMIVKTPAELAAEQAAKVARQQALAVQHAAEARARAVAARAKAAQQRIAAAKVAASDKAAADKAAADRAAADRAAAARRAGKTPPPARPPATPPTAMKPTTRSAITPAPPTTRGHG